LAQALHYKELEFVASPQTAIEALIHINNQLRQPEAAVGVLTYAQKHLAMELKESWYEKLCRCVAVLCGLLRVCHVEK
jgi:FKBP12-rapamycin complex-associated protein